MSGLTLFMKAQNMAKQIGQNGQTMLAYVSNTCHNVRALKL